MANTTILHEGHLHPEQEKIYLHLPFDVPEGAGRIDVTFAYDARISSDPGLLGGNTIDLGIFDSRGIDFLSAGFRGWTGSERSTFFLTPTAATPGYLAGPLTPGRWHVLLGLYKVAPQGCNYTVSITVQSGQAVSGALMPLPQGDLPCSPPPANAAPWLRGELHCHSWHSDGDGSAAELVKLARSLGLDFLAVTDHNNITHQYELQQVNDPGLILIRGMESTTFKGHFNAWGIPHWVDFRIQSPEDMQAALQYAIDLGAVTSCNHPKPLGPDWDYPEVTNYHCVEVWNGPWSGLNEISLEYWLNLLDAGRQVTAVAGSDYHRQEQRPNRQPCTPTTWVYVPGERTPAAILQAVKAGHVSLSSAPDGPFLEIRAGADGAILAGDRVTPVPGEPLPVTARCLRGEGCLLTLLDAHGSRHQQEITASEQEFHLDLAMGSTRYIRAELRDADGLLKAMTNPVYIETGG